MKEIKEKYKVKIVSEIVDLKYLDLMCETVDMLQVGADGIMVEVHNNPPKALSDSEQQMNFCEFEQFHLHAFDNRIRERNCYN